jgi:hypothetical protein
MPVKKERDWEGRGRIRGCRYRIKKEAHILDGGMVCD